MRELIDKSVAFVAAQIKERTYLGSDGKFVTEVEYPEFVRQEMIVNALSQRPEYHQNRHPSETFR